MAGGRPKQTTDRAQTRHVGVRFTAAERAALDARAAAAGLSLSDFIRAASLDAAPPRRRRKADAEGVLSAVELRELNAVGVNLNQIARALNFGTRQPINDELQAAIDALQSVFAKVLR